MPVSEQRRELNRKAKQRSRGNTHISILLILLIEDSKVQREALH